MHLSWLSLMPANFVRSIASWICTSCRDSIHLSHELGFVIRFIFPMDCEVLSILNWKTSWLIRRPNDIIRNLYNDHSVYLKWVDRMNSSSKFNFSVSVASIYCISKQILHLCFWSAKQLNVNLSLSKATVFVKSRTADLNFSLVSATIFMKVAYTLCLWCSLPIHYVFDVPCQFSRVFVFVLILQRFNFCQPQQWSQNFAINAGIVMNLILLLIRNKHVIYRQRRSGDNNCSLELGLENVPHPFGADFFSRPREQFFLAGPRSR
jgi:hypothetical protein